VPGPAGFFYADVPNRIIAYLIDLIVLLIINIVVGIVLAAIIGATVSNGQLNVLSFVVLGFASLGVSAAYFVYMWSSQRGTVGMKLLGLQIGHERDGRSIDTGQGLIRWLILGIPSSLSTFAAYVPSELGQVLSLIGLVWLVVLLYSITSSPTKQGFHDRYAHTIMVKAGRRAA
jgi:uncharacterized RDD family membrane protein YckC